MYLKYKTWIFHDRYSRVITAVVDDWRVIYVHLVRLSRCWYDQSVRQIYTGKKIIINITLVHFDRAVVRLP